MTAMVNFLLGAIAMAFGTAGLVFLRYYRSSRDRLFLYFTAFFWIETIGRALQAIAGLGDENPWIYALRVAAFGLILAGIVDKNLPRADRG